uniref:Secreted protein n=1 Tax=Mesocestoides corti TaxID=53468 RepID=A0A5K3F996_MESCO
LHLLLLLTVRCTCPREALGRPSCGKLHNPLRMCITRPNFRSPPNSDADPVVAPANNRFEELSKSVIISVNLQRTDKCQERRMNCEN